MKLSKRSTILLLILPVSAFNVGAQTLEPRDLDGDPTTVEAYYDAEIDVSWLADANIGLTETFGLERGPVTDYGSEVNEFGGIWRSGLSWRLADGSADGYIVRMNDSAYLGLSGWRLPTATGGDLTCSTQIANDPYPPITWGTGCTGPEVGHMNKLLMDQYGSLEDTPFKNLGGGRRWLDSNGPAGRHYFYFGEHDELAFCGAGRCGAGLVWPVHDGAIGTAITTEAVCIDTDPVGDGWGWNGATSCEIPAALLCIDTDPIGDGWGWNSVTSCRVAACIDTDGDGWGWDGVKSCSAVPIVESECIDSNGDGWGWDGVKSCRVGTIPQTECIDTDGDGWGWNGIMSCLMDE